MAGYPPPSPPTGDALKIHLRAMKAQARAQRDQMKWQRQQQRMQMRAMRRNSIVGPVLLVALGVAFLLVETGRMRWMPMLEWYGRWWPLLLIGAGLVLMAEWAMDQRTQEVRAADGLPLRSARRLGGGTVWLLILLGVTGAMTTVAARSIDWNGDNLRFTFADFDRALGEPHDSDESLSQAITPGGTVTFDNPRGDVTVSGTSDDGQMHIAVHKQVYAISDNDAESKARQLQPVVTNDAGHCTVTVSSVQGGHVDLVVEVPRTVAVTVTADRGQVRVSGMHAAVVINGNRGAVDLSGLDGPVVAHLHNSNAEFSAHSITGPVTLDGRTGDLNVSDINGPVVLTGDFFGTTHLERVTGAVHFHTSRTDFQMARLDGEMELDTGSELRADQMLGPVSLTTRQRNITLERVQGTVQVVDRDGSVTVTSATPLGAVEIANHHGSVDVGVPASAGFVVQAVTQNGAVENDFSLPRLGSTDKPELSGTVGRGGPTIHIETTDGDVTVRKSSVAPLPALPPAPPRITAVPDAPAIPDVPRPVGRLPAIPKAPRNPKLPQAPAPSVPPPPGV